MKPELTPKERETIMDARTVRRGQIAHLEAQLAELKSEAKKLDLKLTPVEVGDVVQALIDGQWRDAMINMIDPVSFGPIDVRFSYYVYPRNKNGKWSERSRWTRVIMFDSREFKSC